MAWTRAVAVHTMRAGTYVVYSSKEEPTDQLIDTGMREERRQRCIFNHLAKVYVVLIICQALLQVFDKY